MGSESIKAITKGIVPKTMRRLVRRLQSKFKYWPPVGWVKFGSLRRLQPVSHFFGYDRGTPIDRHYIDNFLSQNATDIQGNVLEVADDKYTRKFGGEKITKSDVLHAVKGNPNATIVADLTSAEEIKSNTFDSIILTQTLQFIYDVPAVIQTLHRILKPEGVLLATFPGISQISNYDNERWGDFWRFTKLSTGRMFKARFHSKKVVVRSHGNVMVATAFLHGLAAEELCEKELDYKDPNYQVLITVRAVK